MKAADIPCIPKAHCNSDTDCGQGHCDGYCTDNMCACACGDDRQVQTLSVFNGTVKATDTPWLTIDGPPAEVAGKKSDPRNTNRVNDLVLQKRGINIPIGGEAYVVQSEPQGKSQTLYQVTFVDFSKSQVTTNADLQRYPNQPIYVVGEGGGCDNFNQFIKPHR